MSLDALDVSRINQKLFRQRKSFELIRKTVTFHYPINLFDAGIIKILGVSTWN